MGNASSAEEGPYLAPPNILTKVTVKGDKADIDAFVTKGRVDNVQIGYLTKRQVRAPQCFYLVFSKDVERMQSVHVSMV